MSDFKAIRCYPTDIKQDLSRTGSTLSSDVEAGTDNEPIAQGTKESSSVAYS
ncbi:MAG: hypothetical protein RMZ69_15025 [Nostoc sp. ChiQUE01a]|nr:hypothetical protein [Nostoc sp. ChiQUE01a]